jgi:hypothetical protein
MFRRQLSASLAPVYLLESVPPNRAIPQRQPCNNLKARHAGNAHDSGVRQREIDVNGGARFCAS